ncbi:hypothetical protein BO94DRAFT_70327 [Aspergillus sclerotioniger CBS 115572]|uniref:Uncharacterized protein n=1 Tax=Aspergillus sclerotioniger CBS 115572 TaxID=1450535 RepID=A0A317WN70_9EURO|nr:hypothetical protein BO94DRAFT_70327 [Aspergillus sclerotioniger CBS 115572]PWY87201.1 hypothetical protein BO94DRAFT_70327 [Aspergillus sclerotioniger CBS 115572]
MCHRLPMQPFYQASGDRLASSTTDGCPHQTLLLMDHLRKEKKKKTMAPSTAKAQCWLPILLFPLSPALSSAAAWRRNPEAQQRNGIGSGGTKLRLDFGAGAASRCAPFPNRPNGREAEVQGVPTNNA